MISELPAVRRFQEEILEDIRQGRSVVIHIPSYPRLDIRPAIQRAVISELDRKFLYLDVSGNGEANVFPGQILCHRFMLQEIGSEYTCIDALLKKEEYLGNVLWVENVLSESYKKWLYFIKIYQKEVMKLDPLDRTSICLLFVGELESKFIPSDVGLGVHTWRGKLGYLDIDVLLERYGSDSGKSSFLKEIDEFEDEIYKFSFSISYSTSAIT